MPALPSDDGAMFSETDGPTALRRERVQALALSLAPVDLEGPEGEGEIWDLPELQ